MEEALKATSQPISELANRTILDVKNRAKYFEIKQNYKLLISSQS